MLITPRFEALSIRNGELFGPGAKRLLDIAGSHGLYGALIARAHPPMRSEVVDLPQAVEQAQKLGSAEGLDDVVTYRAGDAPVDDLGADYDVVFLGNILHHFTPQQIGELLARVRRGGHRGGHGGDMGGMPAERR